MAQWLATAMLMVVAQVASSVALYRQKPYYCGYNISTHSVTSSDDYITSMFRLPRNEKGKAEGQPVVLQHGFLSNADSWFQLGSDSLPCLLANAGYDVWTTNARGSKYSNGHLIHSLTFLLSQYWDFSFHEMAVYDLPAAINYILGVTKKDKVVYIGHSVGATLGFTLLSQLPQYNNKITMAVALAPVVYMRKKDHLWNFVLESIQWVLSGPTYPGPLPIVSGPTWSEKIYNNFLFDAVKILDNILEKEGSKRGLQAHFDLDHSSIKTLIHLIQMVVFGKFRQFHYGFLNMVMYPLPRLPPEYNLTNIATPHFIMYSDGDVIAPGKDVRSLCRELPTKWRKCREVERQRIGHFDFLSSTYANQFVYGAVMRELARHPFRPNLHTTVECLSSR